MLLGPIRHFLFVAILAIIIISIVTTTVIMTSPKLWAGGDFAPMASCSNFLKEDSQAEGRLASAMVWLFDEFRSQSTLYGKISVGIYSFIIIFGSLTTIMGMIAPIASADCMADPFSPDHPKKGQVDELVWFKAIGRTSGALGTTFLLAVYMLGHSTKSCLLLFMWGFLSYLNFAVVIPNDFLESGGSEAGASRNLTVLYELRGAPQKFGSPSPKPTASRHFPEGPMHVPARNALCVFLEGDVRDERHPYFYALNPEAYVPAAGQTCMQNVRT